jgi:hypothetical protein
MRFFNPDVHDLVLTAFCFGIVAGVLISYLMVAVVWRFCAAIRIAEAAANVAERSRQRAEIELNDRLLAEGRARVLALGKILDAAQEETVRG